MKSIIDIRRSIRSFEKKLVEPDKIEQLFEAARWSPSAMNAQPWVYVYAQKGDALYADIAATLSPGNLTWAQNAPLLIVSIVKQYFDNGTANTAAEHDTGMANHAIALQATSLGLQAHMMGGYDKQALDKLLQLPDGTKSVIVIAVGYPGNPEDLPEPFKQRETATRSRKPIHEFVSTQLKNK